MVFILLLIVAFILDLFIRIVFNLGMLSPDIFLLSVLYITLTRPTGEAFLYAFVAGLIWDITFYDIPGTHSLLYILAVMLTTRLRSVLWAQFSVSRFIIGVLLTAFVRFGEVIFWLSYLEYDIPVSMPYSYIFSGALITGLCFIIFPMKVFSFRFSRKSQQPTLVLGR